ncbi:hypothetical protein BaRGS_00012392 [Batillaria attramentaria]|uniref:Uncharacterized protein n=1 Tax=Batillaria attramentaria TaxID=370345 RepID=A0ABD0LAU8_9CAEN
MQETPESFKRRALSLSCCLFKGKLSLSNTNLQLHYPRIRGEPRTKKIYLCQSSKHSRALRGLLSAVPDEGDKSLDDGVQHADSGTRRTIRKQPPANQTDTVVDLYFFAIGYSLAL